MGVTELIVIFMILLVVFGASRLPALGESLGKTVRSFKRGSAQDEKIQVREQPPDEPDATPPASSASESARAEAEDAEVSEPKA